MTIEQRALKKIFFWNAEPPVDVFTKYCEQNANEKWKLDQYWLSDLYVGLTCEELYANYSELVSIQKDAVQAHIEELKKLLNDVH